MIETRFTSIHFHRYKAFRDYSVALDRFNILVGPNNAGKSTILGAFRILAEGLRKARARNPVVVRGPLGDTLGYQIDLEETLIGGENVFYDYDDSEPATIRFRLSNGNELVLFFPEQNACNLICKTAGRSVNSPSTFKTQFNVSIGFVPILGPVEPFEQLYQQEAARLALLTYRAARNFRNIWYHYPEDFAEFRNLVKTTWPGMNIDKPEVDHSREKPILRMFCPEERIPREIFWAGFGFQVWCQMLTYIVRSKDSSLFIIDEPDIYLHSDLQRQLLGILRTLGPDILVATHSTEIISEADPDDLLLVNKKFNSAKRIKDPTQLQHIFGILGSNLNPTLTQLAKTRRVVFVEGKDFLLFSRFAQKLSKNLVANRADFAVVPAGGFNPQKVKDFKEGIEATLGSNIKAAVIFDRDYRSDEECAKEVVALQKSCTLVRIHGRKELENFALIPSAISRSIEKKIAERNKLRGEHLVFEEDIERLLVSLTDPLKNKVSSKYLARRRSFEQAKAPHRDTSTIDEALMTEFDKAWVSTKRLDLVPGKDTFSLLNQYLQGKYSVSVSPANVVANLRKDEIPTEITTLIEDLDAFRKVVSE